MNRLVKKSQHQALRSQRVRASLTGTADRPRLSIHISNHHITAQIINDEASKTLAYASTVGQKAATGTLTTKAQWVGEEIAKRAVAAKVKTVVFDRGARLYHGRVKALADAAREKGLEF
jgi:large subunit ribosomal protein L18